MLKLKDKGTYVDIFKASKELALDYKKKKEFN